MTGSTSREGETEVRRAADGRPGLLGPLTITSTPTPEDHPLKALEPRQPDEYRDRTASQTCPAGEFLSSLSQHTPLTFEPIGVRFSVTLG